MAMWGMHLDVPRVGHHQLGTGQCQPALPSAPSPCACPTVRFSLID
ncbi:hypothetical protein PspLS_08190 [Pyricularia sp. CBS 133598]|nr:hypothetical protein PspLS_08190 [Pyricularia sp. CBS 133598]